MSAINIICMALVLILTLSHAKEGQAAVPEGQEKVIIRQMTHLNLQINRLFGDVRAAWSLNDPELTTVNNRVKVTLQGPRMLRWAKFYMSINQEFTRFADAAFILKLKCNKAKFCRKTGGPTLVPGDMVYYGMKAKLKRNRKTYTFLGRSWIPFPLTTNAPTSTTTPQLVTTTPQPVTTMPQPVTTTPQPVTTTPQPVTTVTTSSALSCNNLDGAVPVGCKENVYEVPTGYPTSGSGVRNPERGFYKHTETLTSNWVPVSSSLLQSYLSGGYTLIFRNFVLDTFANANISETILQSIRDDFATVRNAGMKVIVRFCYSLDQNNNADAPPLQLQKHIQQLAPILKDNADVISVVQTGFIGVWGEWYYTANYGNQGVLSSTDWENRRQVVYQLLDALPTSRQIQIRTPYYKTNILATTSSVTSAEAHTDAKIARIGHHNDCFLASATDFGTYTNKAVEYPYLQAETLYVSMGGETCNPNSPRSDCTTALQELSELHFNYLNSGYHPDVLQSWVTQGCFDQINASLGYRFAGSLSRYPAQLAKGSTTTVGIRIKNLGWAAPINYRSAQLVLRHSTLSEEYPSTLASDLDLRQWVPGDYDLNLTLSVPSSASIGQYKIYLRLPDGEASLQTNPDYNIVIENLVDSSNANGRLNLLGIVDVA